MAVDLIYYASAGKKKKVITLIKQGVDVDAMNHNEETALFFAAKNGNEAIVKYLLRKKADPNRHNVFGFTPVIIAAINNRKRCLKILIDHGGVFDPVEMAEMTSLDSKNSNNEVINSQSTIAVPLTEIPMNHIYFDYVINNAQIENCYRIKMCQVYGFQMTCKVYVNGTDQKSMMEKEVQTLRSLRHPYVITALYTTCEPDQNQYVLIMEPVSRINLYHVLHNLKEKFSFKACKQILYQTSQACTFIHCEGLLHNFINSSSIYLNADNNVKLGNFEYCTKITEQSKSLPVHAVQMHLPYMASEVLAGNSTSVSADIYSYGCLSWELFGRKIPWSWLSQHDLSSMSKVQHSLQLPLQPSWPLYLRSIIQNTTHKDPGQRGTFSEILHLFQINDPIEAKSENATVSSWNMLVSLPRSVRNKSRVTFSNVAMERIGNIDYKNGKAVNDSEIGTHSEIVKKPNFDVAPRRSSLKSHNRDISGVPYLPRFSHCVSQIQSVGTNMVTTPSQDVHMELCQSSIMNEDQSQQLQLAKFLASKAYNHQRKSWSKNAATIKVLESYLYKEPEHKPTFIDLVRDFLSSQKEIEHRYSWSAISNAIKVQRVIEEERKQKILSDAFSNYHGNATKRWAKTAAVLERDFLGHRVTNMNENT